MLNKNIEDAINATRDDAGQLTPALVVDAARDPKSVLHSLFEWDNTVAGERYREYQARTLISKVHYIDVEKPVHPYYNKKISYVHDVEKPGVQGYVHVTALQDQETKKVLTLLSDIKMTRGWVARCGILAGNLGIDCQFNDVLALLDEKTNALQKAIQTDDAA